MFSSTFSLLLASWAALALSQSAGTQQEEIHSNITWETCSTESGCTAKKSKIVLDANWRWVHKKNGYDNCISWNQWDEKLCPNNTECTKNCEVDGAGPYKRSYGISTTNASALQLNYWTPVDFSENLASRVFLLGENNTYEIFKLAPNREFAFDVDVSALPCGINGALNFVAMDADGGAARNVDPTVGASYGTGYCDAQCPRYLRWINGQTNAEGWTPSETDQVNGVGNYGSCCADMRIWDANSMATALTARPCSTTEQHRCFGPDCGGPYLRNWYGDTCDPDGCSFNPYQLGKTSFYSRNILNGTAGVDTKKKFTVVTQFIGTGEDLEIRRFYIQDGKKIGSPNSQIPGIDGSSLNSKFCDQQKATFGEQNVFKQKGGMTKMYEALEKGMVLAMSILDDHYSHMLWLDSAYPPDRDSSAPGVTRGSCDIGSGDPLARDMRSSKVIFSNIKFGPLNSTSQVHRKE